MRAHDFYVNCTPAHPPGASRTYGRPHNPRVRGRGISRLAGFFSAWKERARAGCSGCLRRASGEAAARLLETAETRAPSDGG